MPFDKPVPFTQQFNEPLSPRRVSHGCPYEVYLLFAGFDNLGLDLSRVWRLTQARAGWQQDEREQHKSGYRNGPSDFH